tara:strand:- start:43 stop:513 length:471 start_codon:yes stop_codon:yes gene_type:complete
MTRNNQVMLDLSGLEELKNSLPKDIAVKVGVLSDGNSREGGAVGNAELGLIQELGSFSRNIPARSWLMMPLTERKAEIVKFLQSKKAKELVESMEFDRLLELMGLKAEGIIDKAFTSSGFGKWQPNSPATVRRKGSSRPLIDTSELRRSVSSELDK